MEMKAEQVILTRGLPKTGQIIGYVGYDDAYHHVGWWKGRSYAKNKIRFIAKTLNGDKVVIDRATGLMWNGLANTKGDDFQTAGTWAYAMMYCFGLEFAGFTDWRIPNIFELISIVNYAVHSPALYTDFFVNMSSSVYLSSTTSVSDVDKAFSVATARGEIGDRAKALSTRFWLVRGGK